MQPGVFLAAGSEVGRRLEAMVSDGSTKQTDVWRALIFPESVDRPGTVEIRSRTGKQKTWV